MKKRIWFGCICMAFALALGCETQSGDEFAEETREAAEAGEEYAADMSRRASAELRTELNEWQAKTANLRAQAEQAGDEIEAETNEAIAELESMTAELDRELNEMGQATSQEWNEFEADARRELSEIQRRYDAIDVDVEVK